MRQSATAEEVAAGRRRAWGLGLKGITVFRHDSKGGTPVSVTLAFLGDVMLGRGVNLEIARRPPESFWGSVLPLLRSADAVIANLECAITQRTRCWEKTPKVFYFRADPPAVEVLRAANVRCVSLANNHTLDFGEEGLLDTLRHLDAGGIRHAGAGRDLAGAAEPAVFDAAGLRVGVIAFTDNEPAFAAGPDHPGTNYLSIATDPATRARVRQAAARARRAGARLVVLSLHWGPNMRVMPPARFRAFARAALEDGVDLLHGHSAHLFQGVELHRRGLILYDTGDFLDDYAVHPGLRNDWSFVFLVEADAAGLHRLRLVPVRARSARVELASGAEREAIVWRMRRLCSLLGTSVARTPEGVAVVPRRQEGGGGMSTSVSAFASTLQATRVWLNELMGLLGWQEPHRAYLALRAVLHALRDRLSVDEAAALGAQLPMLVRGIYYEGWHPHGKPVKERRKEEFLSHIREAFRQDPDLDPEPVARAVFQLLASHVTAGEMDKVKQTLPGEIRSLWPEELRVLPL